MKQFYGFILKIFAPLRLCVFGFILFSSSIAQTLAPGGPGQDAQWATAGKQGVGTSATLESKVWFTLAEGVMTEVYYPDVTQANVHLLQFVVVNPKTKRVETEKDDANHKIESLSINLRNDISPISDLDIYKNYSSPSSLSYKQTNSSKNGDWSIEKIYVTNPKNNSVVISVKFITNNPDNQLYVYYDPSLANSGMGDSAWSQGNALVSSDKDKSSALTCRKCKFEELTNGFLGTPGDGLVQLKKDGKILDAFARAENGNVVQMAKITPVFSNSFDLGNGIVIQTGKIKTVYSKGYNFEISLGFGNTADEALKTAQESLVKGFEKNYQEYQVGWISYLKGLPKVEPKYQAQFNMAAMQLKALEDKTHRGANIASLTVPWGGGDNANENNVGGYHLVWSRDLYQVATAYIALGDRAAASRALDFLLNIQQKPDGSFPQNSWLDGRPFWNSLQLDEVAYPLILAWQLDRFDRPTYENHLKKAADFLVRNGPWTPQERWEEKSGYSPSTIAAEIAGLVCAAEIARRNKDEASATVYLAAADDWARKVEMWTATTNGKYGDGNYYIRLSEKGRPDAGEKTVLNNNAGAFPENEIVDAGFLELVRLGIKAPDDPLIVKSLRVVDQVIKVETPNGAAFYRYNHDGYGEMDDGRRWNWDGKYTGKGRLWALLSGERGQYELALYGARREKFYAAEKSLPRNLTPAERSIAEVEAAARRRLDAMLGFANEGLMIPEQIWDKPETPKADSQFVPELKFGEGTGSATPLAWSMAQFIRLAVNLKAGKNLDTPDVVYDRYVKNGIPPQAANFGTSDQSVTLPVRAGEKFRLDRQTVKGAKVVVFYEGRTEFVPVDENGRFTLEINAPEKEETGIVAAALPGGATAFERVKLISLGKAATPGFSAETIEKLKNAKTSPLFEDGKPILFYRGAAQSVMVAGDLTSWSPGRIFMQKPAADLFAVRLDLPPAARTEYKLIVDGKWMTDEFNPNKLDNGVGSENSVLAMPSYEPTPWDRGAMTRGRLETVEIESKVWNETRKIQVYVPQVQGKVQLSLKKSNPFYPVVYFQDGSDYLNRAKAVEIQENLVAAGRVRPFIMVFIDYKDRMKEYWASDDYARFVATEVVPAIDEKYRTIRDREGRAIIGASLGGVTSVWVGLQYPEVFSRIGGQSPSFWVDDERVVKALEKLDAAPDKFKFYLDDGAFEGTEDTRRVNVLLRAKGYSVTYFEGPTGHNWTAWRDRLAAAFVAFLN
ncbi:MAG: hypothetical protein JSS81_01840 [Acidobacteria bacterium]|nr:hypothetical protein [Acidobacteriota bacterium]